MYCGYDLKFLTEGCLDVLDSADSFYYNGLQRYKRHKEMIKKILNDFSLQHGALNGSAIQENWFPQIKADVFISHSHSDARTAIIFSEILQNCFNLSSFVDSCIWGYSADLLKIIDDEYCLNPGGDTYNYTKRNSSTSHVHMMLSTALMMMMDNCECVFFLNTPNSVTTKDVIKRTQSPWIYSEINISRLIKHRLPQRIKMLKKSLLESSREDFSVEIEYELDMSHFIELTEDNFLEWGEQSNGKEHSLNVLYKLVPPETQGVI
jgi:hypothetical protein